MQYYKLILVLVTALAVSSINCDAQSSRFERGECTWAADLLSSYGGWHLEFSQESGRHAEKWPDLLMNGMPTPYPEVDALMIFDIQPGIRGHGHVSYVIHVTGSKFWVMHSNWPDETNWLGYPISTWWGPMAVSEFEYLGNGKVKQVSPTHWRDYYMVKAFIRKASR